MDQIYDVAVIGAGPSGIAAAFYAAKFGAKAVLLEKDSVIGGTAFKAYVNTLKGQSLSAMDGLLNGITKKAWGSMIFDHEALLDRYYDLIKTQPISLKTGHEVISAETADGRITSLLCSSPSGKIVISAKIVIDATGSLAIANLTGTGDAGAPAYAYMTGLFGKVETVGGKCYSTEAKRLLAEKTAWARDNSKLDHRLFIEVAPTVRADIAQISIRYDNSEKVNGNLMRKQMNAAASFLQEFGYGFENASLICSSKEIFYSAQGSFDAKHTLELSDIEQNKHFSDQVAALPDGDGVGERVYYIPYGSLLSNTFDNLLLCGRNIGAAANAIERIDAIPTHFETGKAAGIAAAIAVKNEITLSKVSAYEITSKTEDSISDKIEILNEVMGGDDENEPIISVPMEKPAQNLSFPPAFDKAEKAAPESFSELDKMLELLGEDVLTPDLDTQDSELKEFAGESDEASVKEPETTEAQEPKNEMENLLDELDGYADISQFNEPENEAAEEANEEPVDTEPESDEEDESLPSEEAVIDEPAKDEYKEAAGLTEAPAEDELLISENDDAGDPYLSPEEPEEGESPPLKEVVIDEQAKNEDEEAAGLTEAPAEDELLSSEKNDADEPSFSPEEPEEGESPPSEQDENKPQADVLKDPEVHEEHQDAEPEQEHPLPQEEFEQQEKEASGIDTAPEDDKQSNKNLYDFFEEAYLYGENDFTHPNKDEAGKGKGVVVFALPDDHRPPLAHKEEREPPKQPEYTEIKREPEEHEPKETESKDEEPLPEGISLEGPEPDLTEKSIVSSDDVINMLYDDSDISKAVRKTPAYYVPDRKINKDDISFLYEDDEQQAPKKSIGSKDKVDSILDMIYEITDPSEQPGELPPKESPPEGAPDKIKKPVQGDKFKSIKDFLYDIGEE